MSNASVNSKFDVDSDYFSGQGVIMLGVRAPNGTVKYWEQVGNVTEVKVSVATTVIDHKGSQDGQRAIDKRLQTETKATASMTVENWQSKVMAKALRGDYQQVLGVSAHTQVLTAYPGKVQSLDRINVSNVSAETTTGATALVAYLDDLTPYDYKVNFDAGSIQFNDGTGLTGAPPNLGAVPTAITVGTTTVITTANTAAVGDPCTLLGFTGASAALVNGVTATVIAASASSVTLALNTTGLTLTIGAGTKVLLPGLSVTLTYDYSNQFQVNALTQPLTDIAVRFEGLNTADTNSPVVVELYRLATDPLKELQLLSDTIGQFQIEGALLIDRTKSTGSKYFRVTKLR